MKMRIVTPLAVSSLLLAACGGGTNGGDGSTPSPEPVSGTPGSTRSTDGTNEDEVGAPVEKKSVTVNIVPFVPNVTTWVGIDAGIFEEHGLDVDLMEAPSPIPIISSMAAEETHIGFASIPGVVQARNQGIDIKCVAEVAGRVSEERDTSGLVAAPNSGIESLGDLEGATVAVVQLRGLNPMNIQELAQQEGVENIEYLQLAFPQMRQALRDGRVDAALITQPFLDGAIDDGGVVLAYPSSQLWADGNIFCFTAMQELIDRDEDLVTRFVEAQNASIRYAGENEDEALMTLVDYMGLDTEQALAEIIPSNFDPSFNLNLLQKMQETMLRQGVIEAEVPLNELIWTGAEQS